MLTNYFTDPRLSATGAGIDLLGRLGAVTAPYTQKPLETISQGGDNIVQKAGKFLFEDAAKVTAKINSGVSFDELEPFEKLAIASVPAEELPGLGLAPDILKMAKNFAVNVGKSALKGIDNITQPVGMTDEGIMMPMKIDDATDMTKMEMTGTTKLSKVDKLINKLKPEEKKILDEFVEGTKQGKNISTDYSVETLNKLGKNPRWVIKGGKKDLSGSGFTESHLAYLGKKFGLNLTDADLAKASRRGDHRAFINMFTGLPKQEKGIKKVLRKSSVKDYKEASEKAAATKRKNILVPDTIKDFSSLKNEMLLNAQTMDQAILSRAGGNLPKGTKHYKIITRFENFADDIKTADKPLYDFFKKQVDDYKAKNNIITDPTKKLQKGDVFLEETREGLVKVITSQQVDRAHSMMQSRLIKLKELVDKKIISQKDYDKLRKPQYLLLNKENNLHKGLENTLDTLLQRKADLKNQGKSLLSTNKGIKKTMKAMENLRVESVLWDPSKMKLRTFGMRPTEKELIERAAKRTQRALKKRGLYSGGIVGINQLVRPI